MNRYEMFVVTFFLMTIAAASPVPLADNGGLSEFLRKAQLSVPNKESGIVKRRIFEDANADGQLKQISLSSLIEDLEKSIFNSALNASKVLTNKDVSVSETKLNDDTVHAVNKRQSLEETTTTESISNVPVTDKIIFQTTEKVPHSNGVPAHIVIDRIAIQPHTGGVALIPSFELKHTKNSNDGVNTDHEIAKITISKTEITSLATTPPESSTSSSTIHSTSNIPSTSSTSTDVPLESSTTPKSIEQLKEAEEELKEKVAEIEAEPVILSARV